VVQDYRIRFVGDLGNLQQFSSSIRGAFSEIRGAYRQSAGSSVSSMGSPDLNTGRVTSQIDAYNRTLTSSGQIFHRYVIGFEADLKKLAVAEAQLGTAGKSFATTTTPQFPQGIASYGTSKTKTGKAQVSPKDLTTNYDEFFTGQYRTVVGNLDKIQAAQRALLPAGKEFMALEQRRVTGVAKYEAAALNDAETLLALDKQRIKAAAELKALYTRGGGTAPVAATATTPAIAGLLMPSSKDKGLKTLTNASGTRYFANDLEYIAATGRNKTSPTGDPTMQLALRQLRGLDVIDAEWNALVNQIVAVKKALGLTGKQAKAFAKRMETAKAKLLAKWTPEISNLEAAFMSTPAIGRDLDQALSTSKDFRRKFAQSMQMQAPYVAPASAKASPAETLRIEAQREAYSKELISKGINPDSVKAVYDYEKGITKLSGTITDNQGRVGQWNSAYDKFGKEIDKNNNSLGRHQGFLRQTGRDFQKVIEWTVATTLVFGAMGVAIGSMSKINQVNNDLARFSITAKTTGAETKQAFADIADIAYKTATPLQNLTAVMDDIALATRRANQTASQWKQAMNAMAEAVGIFTNITGVDTVRATDLLSAAYKQLGIAPNQIISVLNKVTAVAGGNAQAIEDISSALGSVSEAAKAAGLTLDEQIASVQVLSQVTNKTAADIATSFKNLFGAISSPGSVKVLDKFGISVRTATGELRPFLEIYKDIYDARKSGQISEGQLQDVLRGISGGPRRAPDAAALLANMPLIFEQLTKSTEATNEALIANARVLTTNSAKLQQIRTQFDTALIQSFTDAINKLVGALVTLGQAFSGITANGELIAILAQFALIALGTAGLIKVFGLLGSGLRGLRNEFASLGKMSRITGTFLDRFSSPYGPKVTLPYATPAIAAVSGPVGAAPFSNLPIYKPVVSPPTPIARPVVVGPLPTTPYIRPVIRAPYIPTPRPVATPPSAGTPTYRRAMYRTAEVTPFRGSVGYGALQQSGQFMPLINPAADPSKGLKSLREQARAEAEYRKTQASNLANWVKIRGTQEAQAAKDRLTKSLVTNKSLLSGEITHAKNLLSANATYIKQRLIQDASYKAEQIAANIKYEGKQLLGTNKGRIGLGIAGGLAVGGALAAAGAAGVDMGALSTVGQSAGMAMMFTGAPPLMAFGAALTGVSLILSKFNEDQIKAKEAADAARLAVYDEIGVLNEQRKVLDAASKSKADALKTIVETSAITKKSTEDQEKLSTATAAYLDSIFAISAAQKQVDESTQKLIESTKQLGDEYKNIAKYARLSGFSPGALGVLAPKLASGILGINEPGAKGYNFKEVSPDTKTIIGASLSAMDMYVSAHSGKSLSVGTQQDLLNTVAGYNNQQLLDLLNGKTSLGSMGAELGPDAAILMSNMLKGMQEQVKAGVINTEEFQSAVATFGKWTENLYSPGARLQGNISANGAIVQARTALGMLQGEAATNAAGRQSIGADLQAYMSSGSIEKYIQQQWQSFAQMPHGENAVYNGPTVESETNKISKLLFGEGGKGGFLTNTDQYGNTGPNSLKVTEENAKAVFDEVMKLDPAFKDLAGNTDMYNAAVWKYFHMNGIEIASLEEAAKKMGDIWADEKAAMDEATNGAKSSLYSDLMSLQARKQGGEFTSSNAKEQSQLTASFSAQESQIKSLISTYDSLNAIFKDNAGNLESIRGALSQVNGLQGIQYAELTALVPALMNYAQTMGLSATQIIKYRDYITELIKSLNTLDGIKVTFGISALGTREALAALKVLQIAATIESMMATNPISKAIARAKLLTINTYVGAAESAAARAQSASTGIASTLGSGKGSSFGNIPSSSGGSGGGGGGSYNKPGLLDIPDEFKQDANRTVSQLIALSIKNARALQHKIPGEDKANKNAIVAILDGTKKLKQTKGVGEEYLRRAMEELTAQIKKQNDLLAKADTIRRIRVGAGDFAAMANVPVNKTTGISMGGANGPINVTLNLNGTVLTPAQFSQFADMIAASLKKQLAT
jgi:hypothetical protein